MDEMETVPPNEVYTQGEPVEASQEDYPGDVGWRY